MATSAQLRREILAGQWDEALCTLYGTEPAVLALSVQLLVPIGKGGRCMSTRLRAGRSWAATIPIISTGMVLRQR